MFCHIRLCRSSCQRRRAQRYQCKAGNQCQNQARGNLQILQKNPLTGLSNTVTRLNLQSLISTATKNYHDKYSKMAEVARDEGFDGIADWFDTLAKAERMEARLYEDALKTLLD